MKLKVNNVFKSLQGEGPYSGRKCVFVRLTGCIAPFCSFCDSKYSWNEGTDMSIHSILGKISTLYGTKKPNTKPLVVITGGEPFLQDEIYTFIVALLEKDYEVQMETSGKVDFEKLLGVTNVVSPKYINNKFHITKQAIKNGDYFKFVVKNKTDVRKANKFINQHNLDKSCIYLMPLSTYTDEDITIKQAIWNQCVEYDYKYCERIHVNVWGQRKGV